MEEITGFTLEEVKKQITSFKEKMNQPREKATVLYVDDEEIAIKSFKAAFRRIFNVHIASTTTEARAILKNEQIEIIISDQRMPDQTGVDFLKSTISNYPDCMRILLTGYSDIEAVVNAINFGQIYYYLPKPYQHEEIKKVITNASEVYHLRKEKDELSKALFMANQQLEFMLRQKLVDW